MSLRFNGSRDGRRPAPWRQPASGCGRLGLSAIAVAGCQCLTGSLDAPLPRLPEAALRDYPDRDQVSLRQAIAAIHGVSP